MFDNSNFSTIERNMMVTAMHKGFPINASLELLPLCNMDCDMCYIRLSKVQMEQKGRLRTKEEWLSIAEQMLNSGVLFLLLTGGEPLLYQGFKELYIELSRLGFILTINTNGTLIDREWADFFSEYRPRRINISLYGTNKETYRKLCHYEDGFVKTLDAVRLLHTRNVDVRLGLSATQLNIDQISDFYKLGDQLGVPAEVASYMMAATRERDRGFNSVSRLAPEDAARLDVLQSYIESGESYFKDKIHQVLQNYRRNVFQNNRENHMRCMAGGCSFTINWTGNMKPCVISPVPEVNVFETGVEKAWDIIHTYCRSMKMSAKCVTCSMQHVCPTCVVAELVEEGEYGHAPAYLCKYAEEKIHIYEELERTGDFGILF